ncbi:hypothetical protein HDU98_007947 [Podochytrium sp. JEL0797]|nr:hypothetical protein HDU98_007947 [Podochytrium sp. JEL0797]
MGVSKGLMKPQRLSRTQLVEINVFRGLSGVKRRIGEGGENVLNLGKSPLIVPKMRQLQREMTSDIVRRALRKRIVSLHS